MAPPVPHNLDAERAVLGTMLLSRDAIAAAGELCEGGDFYNPSHASVFDAAVDLYKRGEPVSPVIVADELARTGVSVPLEDLIAWQAEAPPTGSARKLAEIVRDHAVSRAVMVACTEVVEGARSGADIAGLLDGHVARLDSLRRAITPRTEPPDLGTFLDQVDDDRDPVIPGLLDTGDRLIVTGGEGMGKSTLLRQLAVLSAGGVHPFTFDPIPPVRVLVSDAENARRLVRSKFRELRDLLDDDTADKNLFVEIAATVNLLDAREAASFEATVDAVAPQLLIVGPSYKLAGGDPTEEETARAVVAVLDRLRARHGCAVVLEAHTPHGTEERPYGASLWKRWPEFGVFLAPGGQLRHWRGQRDERDWPGALQRGGYWPWTPVEVTRDAEPWNGPTRCADAVLDLLQETPGAEMSINAITEALKVRGKSYRKSTVSVAAEQLVNAGRIHVRNGPRNSRLYRTEGTDDAQTF